MARFNLIRFGALLLTIFIVSGCSWFGISEEEEQLRTGSSKQVVIPDGLDEPQFVDIMPIPDIVDYRGIGDSGIDVGLPDALSTRYGVEQIVIRRLGDDMQWVFVDTPTSIIWPQVVLYFEENNVPVASLDPRNGVLETEWVNATGSSAEDIFESIKQGAAWNNQLSSSQHKFRVRVEPGVRTGSTELHIDQKQMATGAPFRVTTIDWDSGSDNRELESEALKALAYYLGDRTAEGPSVSLLAAGLQESKATLEPRPEGMVLRYKLNFDRAWATVGAALDNARVDVQDLDRTAANYYVHYTRQHDPDPGFFSRLFSFGDDDEVQDLNPGHRFTVHLQPAGDEVHVTVASDASSQNATDARTLLLSERLLKLIKEYST